MFRRTWCASLLFQRNNGHLDAQGIKIVFGTPNKYEKWRNATTGPFFISLEFGVS